MRLFGLGDHVGLLLVPADAESDLDAPGRALVGLDRLIRQDAFRQGQSGPDLGLVPAGHDKLVAADPVDLHVRLVERFGYGHEHGIAGIEAQVIVDPFERVGVDDGLDGQ